MVFHQTAEQQAFRTELRDWLKDNLPSEPFAPLYVPEGLEQHRAWERTLHQAGYAAVAWPVEFGGRGADVWQQLIFDEEYIAVHGPVRLNRMALNLAGPTIMAHGTSEQQERWLPGMLRCDDVWCQGFSEPDAGSDLASLRTRAVVDGDELVINGQKTWTSVGPVADRIFALVRTDPSAPKHRGISFVVFDMDTPGVEVRPLVQLHGERGFAEVFFNDVRVPLDGIVGDINDGWRVAMTTLGVERGTGGGHHALLNRDLDLLERFIRARGAHAGMLERLGVLKAWVYAYQETTYDVVAAASEGRAAPDSTVMKLCSSEIDAAVHETMLTVLGEDAELVPDCGPFGEFRGWRRDYWHSRASKIYAGTNQIQKNIIAERTLGLPKEAAR